MFQELKTSVNLPGYSSAFMNLGKVIQLHPNQFPDGWSLPSLVGKSLPEVLKAHSTRAVASSTAWLHGIELSDICQSVTWSTPLTFATHYRLDVRAKKKKQALEGLY